MKGIIAAIVLAVGVGMGVSAAVLAETITLGPDGCGTLKQCISIPNDAALDISFYGNSIQPTNFGVFIDGIKYSGFGGNSSSMNGVPATAADGSTILFTGAFSTYRTCTHSGRGQYCLTHWQLIGGSIQR